MSVHSSACLNKPLTTVETELKYNLQFIECTDLHSTQQGGESSRVSGPVRLWDLGVGVGHRWGMVLSIGARSRR